MGVRPNSPPQRTRVSFSSPPVDSLAEWLQQLDKTHPTFDEAARQEALAPEFFRIRLVQPEELSRRLGFSAKIEQLGDGRLHAEGELIIRYRGIDLAHRAKAIEHAVVQLPEEGEFFLLQRRVRFARLDVGYRILALAEQSPLIGRGKKPASEEIHSTGGNEPAFEHDESRQVFRYAAEAVSQPGAHAGAALKPGPGVPPKSHQRVPSLLCHVDDDHPKDD